MSTLIGPIRQTLNAVERASRYVSTGPIARKLQVGQVSDQPIARGAAVLGTSALQQGGRVRAINPLQNGAAPDSVAAGTPVKGTVGPGLALLQQTISVGSQALQIICPRSVDDVIDIYIGEGDKQGKDTQDPYWCCAWPSAVALSQLLLERPHLVRGRRVLELGCGLGIASTAAALAGAQDVLLTDREPLALDCALLTAAANTVPCARSPGSLADVSKDSQHRVRAALLDWDMPFYHPGYEGVDVVLASDVMYDATAAEPLARLAAMLLKSSSKQPTLLLADPEDRTRHHRQEFLEKACNSKGSQLFLEESFLQTVRMDGVESKVRMLLLSLQQLL